MGVPEHELGHDPRVGPTINYGHGRDPKGPSWNPCGHIGHRRLKILFDHCVTAKLKPLLTGHEVTRAYELRWQELSIGTLLSTAEREGFEVVITVDGNISTQQNMAGRRVAASFSRLRVHRSRF